MLGVQPFLMASLMSAWGTALMQLAGGGLIVHVVGQFLSLFIGVGSSEVHHG